MHLQSAQLHGLHGGSGSLAAKAGSLGMAKESVRHEAAEEEEANFHAVSILELSLFKGRCNVQGEKVESNGGLLDATLVRVVAIRKGPARAAVAGPVLNREDKGRQPEVR